MTQPKITEKKSCYALRHSSDLNGASGFTLIEVVMAIVILASSLSILLGLQSGIISETVDDHYRKQAMMQARFVLAALETRDLMGEEIFLETQRGNLEDIVSSLLGVSTQISGEQGYLEQFQIELAVAGWEIPNVGEQALKRADVTVAWSDDPLDQIMITYFLPFKESDTETIDDEEVDE